MGSVETGAAREADATRPVTYYRVQITLALVVTLILEVLVYRIAGGIPVNMTEMAESILPILRNHVLPEPAERAAYMAYIFLTPVVTALTALLFVFLGRFEKTARPLRWLEAFFAQDAWIPIGVLVFIFLFKYPYPYLDKTIFQSVDVLLYCAVFVFGVHYVNKRGNQELSRKMMEIALSILCAAVTAVSVLYLVENAESIYTKYLHFHSYFQPIFAVLKGKTLGVDYQSQYGFYPYLLAPILSAAGVSMRSFSIVMAGLAFVSFFCNYRALKLIIQNRIVLLLSYFNITFFMDYYAYFSTGDSGQCYYQYFPHRCVFTSAVLLLFIKYAQAAKRHKTLWFMGLSICSALSVVWNFDTGLIIYGACSVGLGYMFLVSYKRNKRFMSDGRDFALFVTAVPLSVIMLLQVITFARSGVWLNLAELVTYQKIFYIIGFMMMPMPLEHPWMLYALLYFIGVGLPAFHLVEVWAANKKFSEKYLYLLFLSVLGIGMFSYYQGRSHDANFWKVAGWGFFVIALLLDNSKFYFQQHNTTQHNTTQHNTTQHNTTQHNTTQHNTTQLYHILYFLSCSRSLTAYCSILINPWT